jgi:hypothetical protein
MTKKAGTQGGSQNNATAWTKRSAGPYGALLIALITLFFSGGCEIDISELYGELDWGTLLGNLQVVYDLNGGGGEPPVDSERYTRNSTVTTQPEPAEVEPPAGAVSFYGWSTSPDGAGQF